MKAPTVVTDLTGLARMLADACCKTCGLPTPPSEGHALCGAPAENGALLAWFLCNACRAKESN